MKWKKTDILALMVGHGKSLDGSWDPGCTYGKNTEAGLMLDIVKVAVKLLRKSGVKVITDADDANNRNMKSSVAWANKKKAKLYMSVHCDYKLATKGVAPLYVSSSGKKYATAVGKYVAKAMGMTWKGATLRKDLYELNATDMPSVVFETGAIKADLKYLKDYKKYGRALAKGILKYIGVPCWVSNRTKLTRKVAETVAYMNKHHFKYQMSYKKCGMSWAEAKKTKRSNCATMICYAAQQCGFLKPGQIFWVKGTSVVCKGSGTKATVKKNFTIRHPKASPKKADLKKGYICGYSPYHTQLFVKFNTKGQPLWYSWGGSDVGDKQPKHKKSYDSKKVMTVLIPK